MTTQDIENPLTDLPRRDPSETLQDYHASNDSHASPLVFDSLSKYYFGEIVALEDISLTINPGEFMSIVGHSGAGKTTLLKMILAEEFPTSGNVFYGNIDIHDLPKRDIKYYRRRIGMVFQNFRLLPQMTAFENIAFAMEAAGRSDEDIDHDVPYVLDLVDLSDKIWAFPQELSGGQKQRLAIARSIVNHPEILIADEPTGNLDPVNTYEVIQLLKKVNSLGTTVILTTHNKGVVDMLKNRVITMEQGRVVRDDSEGHYVL
jgi:cell division transport system ATP-binding protein